MAVLLLMGIPGAGKTTLSHELASHFPQAAVFSLDKEVGRHVENFDAHKSRKDFEAKIREYLESVPYPQWQLIIVDDIFYLKSMRRPFERMARANGFKFVEVHLQCELAIALERNKSRGADQLPEKTILRICNQLELSSNSLAYNSLMELVDLINKCKRMEPPKMDTIGPEAIPSSPAQENEKTLRKCVKWLEDNGNFYGTAYRRLWKIKRINDYQIEYNVLASTKNSCNSPDDNSTLKKYLNLEIDLEKLYDTWSDVDPHIKNLLEQTENLKGIRILGQEPLETLFAFICSANNHIKRISKMVNRLCSLYGSQMEITKNVLSEDEMIIDANPHLLYELPTVEQLKENINTMEAQLRIDGFGYRAQYIAQSVKYLAENNILLENFRYPINARDSLLQFTGVGPKVADCVSLMGLGHHHVVPIDTHVFKCTVKNYRTDLVRKPLTATLHTVIGNFYVEKFGPYAGWAQAVIFNAQLMDKERKRKAPKS